MSSSRRTFLLRTPLLLTPVLPGQCSSWFEHLEQHESSAPVFEHGVASGDPLQRRVILWTRVTPDEDAPTNIFVRFLVFKDAKLRHPVTSGVTFTDASQDYTVKVDVDGLRPGRTYYYRFESMGQLSPIGRTRTLPKRNVEHLRFAVASCSNYPFGFFNAYRQIANRTDLDAVLHLGDYLYEFADGEFGNGSALGRTPIPDRETITLADYRERHAQYKTDPDLQEAHRQHPFIAVWDDHESADNAYRDGAANHQPETEGDWEERKVAAIQAYFEWMPIREAKRDDQGRIYRSFRFGDLVDLTMLDTRLAGRDEQTLDGCDPVILDPNRQMLGETQERWFLHRLEKSRARWHLVGQQVMFGQLASPDQVGCVFNPDQWDGYSAARARVIETLREGSLDNVVILTGDIHTSWAIDITDNPFDPSAYDPATGTGSLAVEFVTPAITSVGIEDPVEARALEQLILATHPHIRFVELNRRGYLLLDITKERVQAEWYHLETILEPDATESLAAVSLTRSGENHIVAGDVASSPKPNPPAPAPFDWA